MRTPRDVCAERLRPLDCSEAAWLWAGQRLLSLLPDRMLSTEEWLNAVSDIRTLASLKETAAASAEIWCQVVLTCKYPFDMPFEGRDRVQLRFRGSRAAGGEYRVTVSFGGAAPEPLPSFRAGDRFAWGAASDRIDRERLALALIEEATGSHDTALQRFRALDGWLVGLGDSWEISQPQLLELFP